MTLDSNRLEMAYLARENTLLRQKLKEVTNLVHAASKTLYELEFGMGLNGEGDLDTGRNTND
jgi:hypothetical protein